MKPQETSLAGRAEQVLQESWQERTAGKTFSVTGVHLVAAATFACAAGAFALLAPWQHHFSPLLALALVVAYGFGGRVLIAVGAGYAVPTQLALVPMLVVLPPAVVPLLVAAGLVLAAVVDELSRRRRVGWLPVVVAVGDAPYALAPAAVFAGMGAPASGPRLLVTCALAALAQCALDYVVAAERERAIRGLRPQQQLGVMAEVWRVDMLLWPIGIVLAEGIVEMSWAVLTLLPLLALLDRLVRERNSRLAQAQARLEELNAQTHRLEHAVRRVGQAFGSGHDLHAVMTTTLQTLADATGAHGGRFTIDRHDGAPVIAELQAPVRDEDSRARCTHELTVVGPDDLTARVVLRRDGGELTSDQEALVRYLAHQAMLAERQIDRHRRLYAEAQTDELTGLANFRRLHRVLDEGVEMQRRHGQPLSLILLDLDRFKEINDRYGHQAGDLVLQTVAFCLRDTARLADVAARYGGEEFAVVLPATGVGGALAVAERAAAAIRALDIKLSATETITITASFGVATLGVHGSDKTELIRAADDALYAAKSGGRDRASVAEIAPGSVR